MKKILFIRPNISARKSSDAMQPLVFAILKALTPDYYETFLMDDCIEAIDYTVKADIVAITVGTYTAKRAYDMAKRFKENGATIILGGFHVVAMPDEAKTYADSIVLGDAEPVWQQLLHDYENGNLKPRYIANHETTDFNTFADRTIFDGKKYFPANLVQWGRGCQHNCDFCSIKSFYKNVVLRPINEVISEIAALDNKTVFFVDDNLYHGKSLFQEFLVKLIPLKKKWACQISMDVTRDGDLIKLMKKAGCIMVLIGIETFNADNLKLMNKTWNSGKNEYSESITIFRKHGIMVYGTFIFGYDFDTASSFIPTVNFAIENKLFLANFNPLYPMPGTPLYARLQNENRLEFEKWWLQPEFYYGQTMFKPLHMNALELEKGCFECKKQFNTISSIFHRLTDIMANARSIRNAVLFLLVNIINRREVFRKQNVSLGNSK